MKNKTIICMLFFAGITCKSFAQFQSITMLDKFENSVARTIIYPGDLITACIPTYAVIKVSVNRQCKVDRMEISDSAEKLFVLEFLSKQKDFDKVALERYLKDNNLKNIDLIIPIMYTFNNNTCRDASVPIETLTHLTDFFKTSYTNKPAMFLKPIGMTMSSVK